MSQTTANVNLTTETFQNWLTKTNELRYALQTIIVTANSTLGNTSGNCHINGFLASNTLVATANLMGGTITANGSGLPQISAANLNITTNTVFTANVYINAGLTFSDGSIGTHSNTHVFNSNLTANGTNLIVGASTKLFANGSAGSAGQLLSSNGSAIYWRTITEMQLVDSISNTSIVYAATANSVKTAYDLGTTAIANANQIVFGGADRVHNGNLTANGIALVIGLATTLYANASPGTAGQVLTTSGAGVYWSTVVSGGGGSTTVLDSVSNTSTVIAAAANSAKTAYDAATAASTKADTAYSNAIAKAANATNLTSGTVPVGRLTGTYSISISGTAGSVDYTNVTNKPTVVSAFTNDAGYITTSGRAFPRRSDGTSIDIIYTGQSGQPSWLVGTNDGLSFYTWNPSNFAVLSATTAGRARPRRSDDTNIDFNYTIQGGQPTSVWGTNDGLTMYAWNPSNFTVASASSATSASSVPWTGVTGRPTAVSAFTNDSGFITTAGRAFPKKIDGNNLNFDYTTVAGTPTRLWGSDDGTLFRAYDPSQITVATATTASSVAWTNVSGRPTDLSSFTNSPGYITSSSSLNATNITSGTLAVAQLPVAALRSVSTGYTGSAQVFIQSATPGAGTFAKGDIWLQI